VLAPEPGIFLGKAVNFDIATRGEAEFFGALAIGWARIGKMESVMELTVVQFGVDEISALGSFVVALPIFGADGLRS